MAGTAKVTWFFKQLTTSEGWSESMYRQYITDLSEVQVPAQTLTLLRAACLSKDSRLLYLRISDLENPRKVIITDYEPPAGIPVGSWDGAYAWNCYLLRATSVARTLRPWFFRDIPASFVDETQPPNKLDPFWTPFGSWVTAITVTDPNWLIQTTDKSLNLHQFITSLGPATNGKILVTPQSIQYAIGADVIISKVKTFPQFNKRWRIAAQDTGLTMELANSTWPPGEIAVTGEGRIALVKYAYEGLSDITPERVSHRKAGRPFGLAVGRARPRK